MLFWGFVGRFGIFLVSFGVFLVALGFFVLLWVCFPQHTHPVILAFREERMVEVGMSNPPLCHPGCCWVLALPEEGGGGGGLHMMGVKCPHQVLSSSQSQNRAEGRW